MNQRRPYFGTPSEEPWGTRKAVSLRLKSLATACMNLASVARGSSLGTTTTAAWLPARGVAAKALMSWKGRGCWSLGMVAVSVDVKLGCEFRPEARGEYICCWLR